MKSICVSGGMYNTPLKAIRKFIIDSILYDTIILSPCAGYFFYQTYPKLAKKSSKVSIEKESKSIPDDMDAQLGRCLNHAATCLLYTSDAADE